MADRGGGRRGRPGALPGASREALHSKRLGVSEDEGFFSLEHLHELGCLNDRPAHVQGFPGLTAKARLPLVAVAVMILNDAFARPNWGRRFKLDDAAWR